MGLHIRSYESMLVRRISIVHAHVCIHTVSTDHSASSPPKSAAETPSTAAASSSTPAARSRPQRSIPIVVRALKDQQVDDGDSVTLKCSFNGTYRRPLPGRTHIIPAPSPSLFLQTPSFIPWLHTLIQVPPLDPRHQLCFC